MKDEDILFEFGRRIKELRNEKNWSQNELAERANLHKNYIGMVERGERNPSLKNIQLIAQAFDMNISDLLNIE